MQLPALAAKELREASSCVPSSVPVAERCEYVHKHAASCTGTSGLVNYLSIYYCRFATRCSTAGSPTTCNTVGRNTQSMLILAAVHALHGWQAPH